VYAYAEEASDRNQIPAQFAAYITHVSGMQKPCGCGRQREPPYQTSHDPRRPLLVSQDRFGHPRANADAAGDRRAAPGTGALIEILPACITFAGDAPV